jgi:hypothetical protein
MLYVQFSNIIYQVIPAVNFQVMFSEDIMLIVYILVDLIKHQNYYHFFHGHHMIIQ